MDRETLLSLRALPLPRHGLEHVLLVPNEWRLLVAEKYSLLFFTHNCVRGSNVFRCEEYVF